MIKKLFLSLGITTTLTLLAVLIGLSQTPSLVTAQGGVTGFENVRVTNYYRAQPRTAISVTNGSTINPFGTYQPLTSGGAVAASLVVEPAGSFLVLVNTGSSTITLTETATLISAGNVVLGATDTATFVSNGAAWIQTGGSNN